jgi:hypothetical protein
MVCLPQFSFLAKGGPVCPAGRRPEGSLLAAKQFLALGKRDALDQALLSVSAELPLWLAVAAAESGWPA